MKKSSSTSVVVRGRSSSRSVEIAMLPPVPSQQDENDAHVADERKSKMEEKWSHEDDLKRLEVLNKSLHHTRHVSSKIVETLEKVEERIAEVERDISAIYKVTSRLRTLNANCSSAIVGMDHVFEFFHLEAEISQQVLDGPGKNLSDYLELLTRLDSAIAFFEQNSTYKSGELALKQLRQLRGMVRVVFCLVLLF